MMKIYKEYKDFHLNIEIKELNQKGLVVFNGASGSGKSTCLKELYSSKKLRGFNKIMMNPYTEMLSSIKVKKLLSLSRNKQFNSIYYEKLKIDSLLDKKVNRLSKGEQRRFYFYMCISTQADIYFFDEPFVFLDESMISIVKEIIEEIAQKNQVVVATHQDIFDQTRFVYQLEKGKLIRTKDFVFKVEKKNN